MPVTNVFAGIAVRDRDAAIEFYERLLGAPPTNASQRRRGGLAALVDDFDERLAKAAAAGIALGPVEIAAGSVRTTWITDPDGNCVQIGQPG